MEIQVNGEKRQWEGPATVLALLEGLGIRPGSVAVEKNRRILVRAALAGETLGEGDALEIIRLVGGG
jgi:thiamine biosynthesis protein ThiS